MADKRMLAKTIIESDPFSDMPLEAQMLYVRLNLAADDDGFISNPRIVMRACGASEDSMKILIAKKFVLAFQKGDNFIYLIKHWKIHNTIQKDRYKASAFKELLREVYLDENKSYSMTPGEGKRPALPIPAEPECIRNVSNADTERIQDVSEVETQIRLDKNRLEENREDKNSIDQSINDNAPAAQAGADIDPYNQKIISFVRNGMYDTAAGLYRLYRSQGLDVIHPGDVKT